MIKDGKLYADTAKGYHGYGTPVFETTAQPNSSYLLAKQLLDNFPQYLLSNPGATFGCPNCVDQGGLGLTMTINGKTTFWNLDSYVNNDPAEIRSYVQQLGSVLAKL